MSSFCYNAGSLALQKGDCDFLADDIEIILVKSTYTPNRDDTHTVYAAAEISGISGYVGGWGGAGRKGLGTKTLTSDTVNDRTVYGAANPSAYTLGIGETVGGMIIGKRGTASDVDAIPLFFIDLPDTATTGSTFEPKFADGILAYTKQNP